MNLIERLTIEREDSRGKRTVVTELSEISQALDGSDSFYLCVDGKSTHAFSERRHKRPRKIKDIGSKRVVLMPLDEWVSIGFYNNLYDPNADNALVARAGRVAGRIPKELIIYSDPFHPEDEKAAVLDNMLKKINAHMADAFATIDNKESDQD